ncbi:MAG TPA: ATP-binding protein, partial [Bacteroidota bacterium]|nr:ATP-binding protein [Bacteroidota bacterium]
KLINDLLLVSRVATQGKELGQTDFNAVLQSTLANLRKAIEERNAVVTADPLPKAFADGTQMIQLFQNLIENAMKFCDGKNPEIHISAAQNGKNWIFSVQDNGIGIEKEFYERIFIIFQRLHDKSRYPGTGIGLAVCKKIVERHGGRIWVESEPGNGATFYFTLPAKGI